jgi:hypothetical protein
VWNWNQDFCKRLEPGDSQEVNQQLTIGDLLEPDQNQIRFSKLKLGFIFLKNQTQKQIPDSIYVCNLNLNQNHSNFYVITRVGIGGSS